MASQSVTEKQREIELGTLLATESYGDNALPDPFSGTADNGYDDDYQGYFESLDQNITVLTDAANLLGSHFDGGDIGQFTEGGLYRGTVVDGDSRKEVAEGLIAITRIDGEETLILSFRGTDADDPALGDMQAFSAKGNFQHYQAHRPLIEAAVSFADEYDVPKIVVAGHSLGGTMADVFRLTDATRFVDRGMDVTVVSIASPGVDNDLPLWAYVEADFATVDGNEIKSLQKPDFYFGFSHSQDLVGQPNQNTSLLTDPFVPNVALKLNERFDDTIVIDAPSFDNDDVFYGGYPFYKGFGAEHNGQIYLENLSALTGSGLITEYTGAQSIIVGVGDMPSSYIGPGPNDQGLTQLDGSSAAEVILGLSGDDVIVGRGGNDLLDGGAGSDALSGGVGQDSLSGGADADTLDGGGGTDTVVYRASDAAVDVSITTGEGSGGHAEGDTLSSIENLVGSGFSDHLSGGSGANILMGEGGDDTLNGLAGDDTLGGGAGTNYLFGGDGHDEALFAKSIDDYSVTVLDDGRVLVRETGISLDVLSDIEQLRFVDSVMAALPSGGFKLSYLDNPDGTTIVEGADAADDLTTPYLISPGDSFRGVTSVEFLGRPEADWIAVDLIAGRDYRFNFEVHDPASAGYGGFVSPVFSIHDAAGQEIVKGQTHSAFGETITLEGTAIETGRYYMAVSGGGVTVSYDLTVEEASFPVTQTEFVDAPADATTQYSLALGESFAGGENVLGAPTDVDWIKVELVEGEDFRIAMTSDNQYDHSELDLFSSDGTAQDGARYTEQFTADTKYIEGTAPQTGTYYVQVTPYNADYIVTYESTVFEADVTESIDASDGLDTGYTITSGQVFNGFDYGTFDNDRVRFIVDSDRGFELTVSSTSNRTAFVILDEQGQKLDEDGVAVQGVFSSDGDYSQSNGAIVVDGSGWDVGTYYVSMQSNTGAYQIQLTDPQIAGASAGADRLVGTTNGDVIRGAEGNDTISGLDGRDTLEGGAGDDLIFGDVLPVVHYSDTAASVYRLYQSTLGRAPDAKGHRSWTESLATEELSFLQAANGFVNSAEFQTVYGALDDTGFVNLMYQNVLGRPADAGGLSGWVDALESGQSRAQVVLGFSNSGEFKSATAVDAATYARNSTQQLWTDDVFRLYQATLGRAPDAGGLTGWTELLGSGTEYTNAVAGFVRSPEFKRRFGDDLSDEHFVQLLYQNVLDRAADSAGLAGWLSELSSGASRADVVRGFAQSGEFRNKTADPLEDWIRTNIAGDKITGGAGDDAMAGGFGSDLFVFSQQDAGQDVVLDLEAWDSIDLTDFEFGDLANAQSAFAQNGADVVFASGDVEVAFKGADLATFDEDMLLV